MKKRSERFLFILYLAGYLILAVPMALYQPHVDTISAVPVSPPDEYFRMLIPQYICQHGTLPTGLEEEREAKCFAIAYNRLR